MTTTDRPLSYWITVARMGFENDFHRLFDELGISQEELAVRLESSPAYVSKVLNGTAGNFQLSTMAKWARAIDAIVQIRLIKDGKEVVRVLDVETAIRLEDQAATSSSHTSNSMATVTTMTEYLEQRDSDKNVKLGSTSPARSSYSPSLDDFQEAGNVRG